MREAEGWLQSYDKWSKLAGKDEELDIPASIIRSLLAELEQAEAEREAAVQWLSNCVFSNVWDTSTLPDGVAASLLDMLEEGGEE